MQTKLFELRDEGTFIAIVAIRFNRMANNEAEQYLIRRGGYSLDLDDDCILMGPIGCTHGFAYDPYDHKGCGPRTFPVAHEFIAQHWDELESGSVVDVSFILGESAKPKVSERLCEYSF